MGSFPETCNDPSWIILPLGYGKGGGKLRPLGRPVVLTAEF